MNAKLTNLLRCYASGMGIKGIAAVFDVSRNTVRKYVRLWQESSLTIEQLLALPEHRLREMFTPKGVRHREPSRQLMELEALLPDYVARLSRKGVTVKSLYEEYRSAHPEGYLHSAFRLYVRQYRLQCRNVTGHVEHLAGDQMYIDYAGDKLEIVDESTGETAPVEVFVAILPCSHYTYCEAVRSQKREDLISACENALHFYGGVPMAIVPDNLRSAVSRSDRNEPVINEEFASFAEHYGCAVFPARVRHPKDKALVENAVKLMYRSVYVAIEGHIFHDLASLNKAIHKALDEFNGKRMSGRKESRTDLFRNIEQECLRPLPALRYQQKQRRAATVMRNSYVTLDKHHYSVPTDYVGKRVELVYDADTVSIYHGFRLITTHQRSDVPYEYTTKSAHNLPVYRGNLEQDLDEIYQRAAQIDNIVLNYLREVTAAISYTPKAFRSCRGILSLEKKYTLRRLVAACACASQMRAYGYQEILDILQKGSDAAFMTEDEEATAELPQHKNIRGRDYFNPNKNYNNNKKTNNNDNHANR